MVVGLMGPEGRHLFVRPSSEKERRGVGGVVLGDSLVNGSGVGGTPAAVDETAVGVLLGGAEALHPPVDGQELDDNQGAHDVEGAPPEASLA